MTFALRVGICPKEGLILLPAAASITALYFKCWFLPQGIFSHSPVVYNNEKAGLDLERAMCADKIKLLLRN